MKRIPSNRTCAYFRRFAWMPTPVEGTVVWMTWYYQRAIYWIEPPAKAFWMKPFTWFLYETYIENQAEDLLMGDLSLSYKDFILADKTILKEGRPLIVYWILFKVWIRIKFSK